MRPHRKSSNSVHDLRVYLIWITKYRYKVLSKDISVQIREIIPQLAKRYLRKQFGGIGYAAFSFGHVTDEMIKNYLGNHKNAPNHNDDDFKIE